MCPWLYLPQLDVISDPDPIDHGDITRVQERVIFVDDVDDSLSRCGHWKSKWQAAVIDVGALWRKEH